MYRRIEFIYLYIYIGKLNSLRYDIPLVILLVNKLMLPLVEHQKSWILLDATPKA